jgi:hypothetical protein
MKKYGDRIFSNTISDEENQEAGAGYDKVLFGGCGVRFGSFRRPTQAQKKNPRFDFLSFLRLKRKRNEE